MEPTQIHLLLNHLPVIGTLFAVAALAAGLVFRSAALVRFGMAVVVLVALVAIPVLLTGEPAEERLERISGVSKSTIERHEEASQRAFLLLEALGFLALIGLARSWKKRPSQAMATAMLVLTLGMSGVMAWTSHLGGLIRHTEIRTAQATPGPAEAAHEGEERH